MMRTGEEWHRRVRTRNSRRKSHINFLVAYDGNSSTECSYVTAIQADMQRRRAETGAENLHWTNSRRRSAQCDFRGGGGVCPRRDRRVVDPGGQTPFSMGRLYGVEFSAYRI